MIILLVFHLKITFQTLGYLESYIFAFSVWVSNLLNFSKARTFFLVFCQPGLCGSEYPHFILSLPLLPESVAIFAWVDFCSLPWSWLLAASHILLLPVI